ncbi:hypothetical protein LB543_01240 [Mesorhizobium sp. ESP7-2]|uniref:hypothetical protein n=1 Tax=Mesorhizobium sp. ESP7-2 TaxID=2876622 RepID=UPI001CCBCEB5|nr:hypothetical protein [Mesorhizobium sp. ESP7-2]MBZ9705353.1 hypothetical protein [Mesorhizobium sp. ESP7-2]
MKRFWESSPEWQRKRELFAALEAATGADSEAGATVLACLRIGILGSIHGRECRAAYLRASEARDDAFVAWSAARDAFKACAAGQAHARYLADPLGATMTESEAA